MKRHKETLELIKSKYQLSLYSYDKHFRSFIDIFEKRELSYVFLLNGPKGIGKSTFAYHLINYLFSKDDSEKYSLEHYTINKDNVNFNLISKNIHPNFFLLENDPSDDNIKVDQVRKLLNFLSKTTFSKEIKIIMIDNAEYLNRNSSNALLKVLEEPNNNTFFFIIQNSSSRISNTVKSRCLEYKFFFNEDHKKAILKSLIEQYNLDYDINKLKNNLFFDTPGNLIKYLLLFNESGFDISRDKASCILYLIEKYQSQKDSELLTFASLFIDYYYNELILNNKDELNYYFSSRNKIFEQINNMKKFNLDKKNLIILLKATLKNEI